MRKIFVLLLYLVLLGPLGIDFYLPVISNIAISLNTNESIVRSTIALFVGITGIGQLITGVIADYFGRRPLALLGITLYIIGSILAAISFNIFVFIMSRIIQALAICCTNVVLFSCIRDKFNSINAVRAFNVLNCILNIVPIIAPMIGGLLSSYLGWRSLFWSLSIYSFIVWILFFLKLEETLILNSKIKLNFFKYFLQYWKIIKQLDFVIFALANASAMSIALTYVSMSTEIFVKECNLSIFQYSILFGINGLLVTLINMFINLIIIKMGRILCLRFSIILMLLGLIFLFIFIFFLKNWQNHWLSYILPISLSCSGLSLTMSIISSYILEPFAKKAGIASALHGFIQMTGASLISLLIFSFSFTLRTNLIIVIFMGILFNFLALLNIEFFYKTKK